MNEHKQGYRGYMKRLLLLILVFAAYTMAAVTSVSPEIDDAGCYHISTVEELYGYAKLVNSGKVQKSGNITCAMLEKDIVINKNVMDEVEFGEVDSIPPTLKCLKDGGTCSFDKWTPIGDEQDWFYGIFDGQGHTISGVFVDRTGFDDVGFFGYGSGFIKNLNIVDSYIKGDEHVGGIIGNGGSLYNCSFSGVVVGKELVGGIAGLGDGTFRCHNEGFIWGNRFVGGIGGTPSKQSYNTGSIYCDYSCGGISAEESSVHQCYNTGSVKGACSGGIGGTVRSNGYKRVIENSFNIGPVSGSYVYRHSGIAGDLDTSLLMIDNSYSIPMTDASKPGFESDKYGFFFDETAFVDGTIVNQLNNDGKYVDVWEQGESHPVFRDYSPKIKDGVYQIENEEQFVWFAELADFLQGDPNLKAVLHKDLVFNKNVVTDKCLANASECKFFSWDPPQHFAGVFDGQHHSISGLFTSKEFSYTAKHFSMGLFQSTRETGVVQNVIVKDSYFNSDGYSGDAAIVGENEGTVSECFFENVFTGDEPTEVYKYVATTGGTLIETRTVNRDLWFDGKKLIPYKIKACQSPTGPVCEKTEKFKFSLYYGAAIQTPYSSFESTMDSLGYLAFKYRLKKTNPSDDPEIDVRFGSDWYEVRSEVNISEAGGFCTTYTSDHDIQVKVGGRCSATLPKTNKVSTIETPFDKLKYYNFQNIKEVGDCSEYLKSYPVYISLSDAVEAEGIVRLFEFGPMGTCKGNGKIAEEVYSNQCYTGKNWIPCEQYEQETVVRPTLNNRGNVRIVLSAKTLYFYGTSAQAKFQMVNLKGQIVKNGFASSSVLLDNLKNGVYVIRVQDGLSSFSKVILLNMN